MKLALALRTSGARSPDCWISITGKPAYFVTDSLAHTTKETREYLTSMAGRLKFVNFVRRSQSFSLDGEA